MRLASALNPVAQPPRPLAGLFARAQIRPPFLLSLTLFCLGPSFLVSNSLLFFGFTSDHRFRTLQRRRRSTQARPEPQCTLHRTFSSFSFGWRYANAELRCSQPKMRGAGCYAGKPVLKRINRGKRKKWTVAPLRPSTYETRYMHTSTSTVVPLKKKEHLANPWWAHSAPPSRAAHSRQKKVMKEIRLR